MLTNSVKPTLVEQYADMHAVDFRCRRLLLESYQHDFDNLYQVDTRLMNYMRGLELLSNYAERHLQEQLLSPLSIGDVFTIALFSARTKNPLLLEGCLTLTQAIPHLLPAIKSLIEWAPAESILWHQLTNYPCFKALAVCFRPELSQLCQLTENDITYLYDKAEYAPLLVYALFYQKHRGAHKITQELLATDNALIKTAIIDVLFRHRFPVSIKKEETLPPLIYSSAPDVALKAARLFTLYTHYSAEEYLTLMTPKNVDERIYIQALGWAGYVSNIPLLIEYLDIPEYARLSAASITTITGSLPEKCGWDEKNAERSLAPDAGVSENPDDDPDIALTWPDKGAFLHWWQKNIGRFDAKGTYLNGVPANHEGLSSVLRHGSLILRRLAADRLQYQQSSLTLNTDAPAFYQKTSKA